MHQSYGRNLALAVFHVQYSLDNAETNAKTIERVRVESAVAACTLRVGSQVEVGAVRKQTWSLMQRHWFRDPEP